MARLYANENFPLPAVEELRRRGHDVLTTQDAGKGGQAIPDAEVLAFSVAEDRILLTLNRKHFIRLHGIQPGHAGIIACTFDPDFSDLADRIHRALCEQSELSGQLIRIQRPNRT
jgi:hypothetical protein